MKKLLITVATVIAGLILGCVPSSVIKEARIKALADYGFSDFRCKSRPVIECDGECNEWNSSNFWATCPEDRRKWYCGYNNTSTVTCQVVRGKSLEQEDRERKEIDHKRDHERAEQERVRAEQERVRAETEGKAAHQWLQDSCGRFTKRIMKLCDSDGWEKSTGTVGDTEFMTCINPCDDAGEYQTYTYSKKDGECWEQDSSHTSNGICPNKSAVNPPLVAKDYDLIGVPECDEFIKKCLKCSYRLRKSAPHNKVVKQAAGEWIKWMKIDLPEMIDAWNDLVPDHRNVVINSCKTLHEGAKKHLGYLKCDW